MRHFLLLAVLLLLPVLAEDAGEGQERLYLRSGAEIRGRLEESRDGFALIRTAAGRITFPDWLLDRSGRPGERARTLRRYEKIDDPELVERLRVLNEGRTEAHRLRNEAQQESSARREEIDRLRQEGDASGLAALAERVSGSLPEGETARAEAGKSAAEAFRAAAEVEARKGDPESALRAAGWGFRAFVIDGDLYQRTGRHAIRQALQPVLRDDPLRWEAAARILEQVEDFEDWSDLPAEAGWWDGGEPWRWDPAGANWDPKQPPPRRHRIVRKDGSMEIREEPPADADGVATVWVAANRELGGDNLYGSAGLVGRSVNHFAQWWRIFWCPVEKRFKRDTVPERLALSRWRAHSFLRAHAVQEETDFHILENAFKKYRSKLGMLATLRIAAGSDRRRPAAVGAPDGMEKDLEEMNQQAEAFLAASARIVRRRAAMEAGFERLRSVRRLSADAREGKPPAALPSDPPPAVGASSTPEAILAALGGLDLKARRETLKGEGVRKSLRDPRIFQALQDLSGSDVSLREEREIAQRLLKREK